MDIIEKHQERMDELEYRREYELPETKEMIENFQRVLGDESALTDKMANAVFKNHRILRNARLKERARRKKSTGDKTLDANHLIEDPDRYEAIQTEKKEHNNYLRRLKGKCGSKLSSEERMLIHDWIRDKQQWAREVESDQEYIDYVFKSRPIIEEYERELERTQEYLREDSEHAELQAIAEVQKRQRITDGSEREGGGAHKRQRTTEADTTLALVTLPPDNSSSTSTASALPAATSSVVPKYIPKRVGTIDSFVIQSDAFSRLVELQHEYCALVGLDPPKQSSNKRTVQWHMCAQCNVEMIAIPAEGSQTCPSCAESVPLVDTSLRTVPFNHPVNAPKSRSSYEKLSYMEKWMRMVSGELNSEIPDEDWGRIYQEAMHRRWSVVDRNMVRKLLKDLGLVKYYEMAYMITNELNGVPLVKFTAEEKQTLIAMFQEANTLFDKCPFDVKRRSSFISYPYFFYQACKLAGYQRYLDSFPMLIGQANRKHHDRIWKWICDNKETDPSWTFYPTT